METTEAKAPDSPTKAVLKINRYNAADYYDKDVFHDGPVEVDMLTGIEEGESRDTKRTFSLKSLKVNGPLTVIGNLNVESKAAISGNIEISGSLYTGEIIALKDLHVKKDIFASRRIHVSGNLVCEASTPHCVACGPETASSIGEAASFFISVAGRLRAQGDVRCTGPIDALRIHADGYVHSVYWGICVVLDLRCEGCIIAGKHIIAEVINTPGYIFSGLFTPNALDFFDRESVCANIEHGTVISGKVYSPKSFRVGYAPTPFSRSEARRLRDEFLSSLPESAGVSVEDIARLYKECAENPYVQPTIF